MIVALVNINLKILTFLLSVYQVVILQILESMGAKLRLQLLILYEELQLENLGSQHYKNCELNKMLLIMTLRLFLMLTGTKALIKIFQAFLDPSLEFLVHSLIQILLQSQIEQREDLNQYNYLRFCKELTVLFANQNLLTNQALIFVKRLVDDMLQE